MRTLTLLLSLKLFILLANGQGLNFKTNTDKSISLVYENDFFTQTDEYYTQGIRLTAASPVFRYSPLMFLLPGLRNSSKIYALSAVQDCFTPTSISSDSILRGNHPFAGYIYLGHIKTSSDYYKKQMLTAEIDVGEIGSCASCKQEQEAIHRWTNNLQPDGWQYQIGTGLLLDYKLRYEKALYADTAIDVDAFGQINAGTVNDNALAGLTFHFGKMNSYYIISGFSGKNTFQLYGIFQAWVEGVAYNGVMQGALFIDNSIYTLSYKELSPVVFGNSYGIGLSFHKVSIIYVTTRITNEILTGYYHGYGHIELSYQFK